jgi:hypothetical protein
MAAEFREKIPELARAVRREPGCLAFTAYEARDIQGRFYVEVIGRDPAKAASLTRALGRGATAGTPGAAPAGDMYVSVNTVKTHIRNLYVKLGTHRRAEAVEYARALGLLAPVGAGPAGRSS